MYILLYLVASFILLGKCKQCRSGSDVMSDLGLHCLLRTLSQHYGLLRPSQRVSVPLFPWKKNSINFSLVPQSQNLDFLFSLFPKIAFVPLFPSVLDIVSLFPWIKWPYSPIPQNSWEGLVITVSIKGICSIWDGHFDKGVLGFKVWPYLARDKRQSDLCHNWEKRASQFNPSPAEPGYVLPLQTV